MNIEEKISAIMLKRSGFAVRVNYDDGREFKIFRATEEAAARTYKAYSNMIGHPDGPGSARVSSVEIGT